MRFLTTVKLSQNREQTPDGYLLCKNAVIARTGKQLYGPGETPVRIGPKGYVEISRTADELFSDKTLASFNGKPLISLHPRDRTGALEFVNPKNWKDLTLGIVMNPRRGQGADEDLLLADILVTDERTIFHVKGGKPELSAGYDCDYFEHAPGIGEQRNIIGNHVAIVPAARCGPRCAIGDEAANSQEKPVKKSLIQRLAAAFQSGNEAEHQAALDEAMATAGRTGDAKTCDCGGEHPDFANHVQAFNDHAERNDAEHADFHRRLEALEGRNRAADEAAAAAEAARAKEKQATADAALEQRIVVETGAEVVVVRAGTADSKLLAQVFQAAISGAEVLKPGLQVPTFDEAAKPAVTLESIDGIRRKAVEAILDVPEMRSKLEAMAGGQPLEIGKMTADEIRTTFNAAVELRKTLNTAALFHKPAAPAGGATGAKAIRTPADLNRLHAERFGAKH